MRAPESPNPVTFKPKKGGTHNSETASPMPLGQRKKVEELTQRKDPRGSLRPWGRGCRGYDQCPNGSSPEKYREGGQRSTKANESVALWVDRRVLPAQRGHVSRC